MKYEYLKNNDLSYFINYNKELEADRYRLSEARPYDLDVIKKWIKIRDDYEYTEDTSGDGWECIQIVKYRSKYGTNYIYIHPEKKLWRARETASEFYGSNGKMFEFCKEEKQ